MEIQIRTTELTIEQEALEEVHYTAAKILRAAGIQCEVRKLFAPKPQDEPACIHITVVT